MADKDVKKTKYRIKGSDFRFQGKTYQEGALIELTAEQYKKEKKKITLEPLKKEVKDG